MSFSGNESYIFHPRNSILQKMEKFKPSQSSQDIFNSKVKSYNALFNNNNNKNIQRFYPSENTFYNKKLIPPIYFYRKVLNRYKYNMTSVPEYLIKTNGEKNFLDKLESNLKDENDKKKFNEMINVKEKEKRNKIKDRYKPEILDVQTILKYRPNLYLNSMGFTKTINPNMNKPKQNEVVNMNKNKEEIKTEKINKNETEVIKPISDEDQIKYKYQISDIHNKRNENVIKNKSAEKYLFRNKNEMNNTCYPSSKSKSDWIPNRDFGIKMNSFSSVSYNILSPMCKGFNKFISPTELNKSNLYNECPAFHKVKSISEFIDLTSVSSRNNLGMYNTKNKKNKNPNFKFRANVATDHLNAYHINRDLIPNPT